MTWSLVLGFELFFLVKKRAYLMPGFGVLLFKLAVFRNGKNLVCSGLRGLILL